MTKKPQRLGDQPIEQRYRKMMNGLATGLDEIFNGPAPRTNKANGFILMVFPFSDHGGRCNYISNANREDVIVMLKEQIARFEEMPEVEGNNQ